jgi:hypothetical protein
MNTVRFGQDRNSHPIFNHGHDKVPLTATTSDAGNKTNLPACLIDHLIQAIRIHSTGGPDVMHWEEVELGGPKTGEVFVRQTAVGVNYIDVYHRTGEKCFSPLMFKIT